MINKVIDWLDDILEQDIPESVVAFCFNLYDDGDDHWSMELVGTGQFDVDNEDWACDEITNFGTREERFIWKKALKWDDVLEEMICNLKEYLKTGKYAHILTSKDGVGVGFVDGDINILYIK